MAAQYAVAITPAMTELIDRRPEHVAALAALQMLLLLPAFAIFLLSRASLSRWAP